MLKTSDVVELLRLVDVGIQRSSEEAQEGGPTFMDFQSGVMKDPLKMTNIYQTPDEKMDTFSQEDFDYYTVSEIMNFKRNFPFCVMLATK